MKNFGKFQLIFVAIRGTENTFCLLEKLLMRKLNTPKDQSDK